MTAEPQAHDGSSKADGDKARAADVQSLLAKRIEDLEAQIQTSEYRTREVAKKHKKSIRDVQRLVADKKLSQEDLVAALQQRTLTALNDAWRLEKQLPDLEAKVEKLGQQNQVCQAELAKGATVRAKLQDLCRELQKQNKEVHQESRVFQEREEAKRKQLAENLDTAVASITDKLDHHSAAAVKQSEENAALREQLQRMMATVQASEEHSAKQTQMFDLQKQLWEAQQQQQAELSQKLEDRGNVFAEKYDATVKENSVLAQEVTRYHDQFQEFQGTLKKSNAMFDDLRKQVKAARGKEHELLQRNASLQKQYEKTGHMLLSTAEENKELKATVQKLTLANDRLQSLCRALQVTRKNEAAESGHDTQDNLSTEAVEDATSAEPCKGGVD